MWCAIPDGRTQFKNWLAVGSSIPNNDSAVYLRLAVSLSNSNKRNKTVLARYHNLIGSQNLYHVLPLLNLLARLVKLDLNSKNLWEILATGNRGWVRLETITTITITECSGPRRSCNNFLSAVSNRNWPKHSEPEAQAQVKTLGVASCEDRRRTKCITHCLLYSRARGPLPKCDRVQTKPQCALRTAHCATQSSVQYSQ